MLLEPVIPWLRQAILSFFDAKKYKEMLVVKDFSWLLAEKMEHVASYT